MYVSKIVNTKRSKKIATKKAKPKKIDTTRRDKEIIKRYLAEEPITSIGARFLNKEGLPLSRQRVYQILGEARVYRPHVNHKTDYVPGSKTHLSDAQIDAAVALKKTGMSWTNIAKQEPYNVVTRGTLYRVCTNRHPDMRKHPK